MNLSDEIRKQIEKNKGLKLAVGEINNHLSILENLVRKDIIEQVDDAYQRGLEEGKKATFGLVADASNAEYQRGFEDGKAVHDKGCEGCEYAGKVVTGPPCITCCNSYRNQWTAKDDKIEVGDEVIYNGTKKCFVVRPESDDRYAVLIDSNGNHHHANHSECEKTGRHFDIDKILEEMRYDS